MKRKIYDSLLAWKAQESERVALLIDGARRVGKSYIVEEFARNEYKSHILIDFNKVIAEQQLDLYGRIFLPTSKGRLIIAAILLAH